jgi:predicted protein tyrosine phosphatase
LWIEDRGREESGDAACDCVAKSLRENRVAGKRPVSSNVGGFPVSPMKHVLFICSQNRLRSPTAEQVFSSHPGIEVASAGMSHDAETPVSAELVSWADVIFVMEETHRNELSSKFNSYLQNKRLVCLDIPDDYEFMDPTLIKLLKAKVTPFLLSV